MNDPKTVVREMADGARPWTPDREEQRKQNKAIGEGIADISPPETLSLDTALKRFVLIADGKRVGDIQNPVSDLAFSDWTAKHAHSTELVQKPNGAKEAVSVAKLWLTDKNRPTADTRTFRPGAPLFTHDPDGRHALNTWRPYDRSSGKDNPAAIQIFLEQVRYLFGADSDRVLDWLAHIEQRPGVLPHRAWLHISQHRGTGRNWLAGLLCRVWTGHVAANVDLSAMLDSGFNGDLSRKLLAIVDEIREGARNEAWTHSERLKQMVTAEFRLLNPKYGRQIKEYNACRWLLFSNYESAIPIERGDRRFEVHICEKEPRPADYYGKLYRALDDKAFVGTVARYLQTRDLSGFNPGAWAELSDNKQRVIDSNRTEAEYWAELLVKHWPADVVESAVVAGILGTEESKGMTPALRRVAEGAGIAALGTPLKISGKTHRVSILRNRRQWAAAWPDELRAELTRAPGVLGNAEARDFLLSLAAEESHREPR